MPPTLLELCEDAPAYRTPPPRRNYVRTDEWVFNGDPSAGVVVRLRLRSDRVASAAAELRELGRRHSLEKLIWMCGSLSQPADLVGRLQQLGLVPWEVAPVLTSMAIERPPAGSMTAEIRRVETYADFCTAWEINWAVYDVSGDDRERARAALPQLWEDGREQGAEYYLGYRDGEPVGWARGFLLEGAVHLVGAATLAGARGGGVYTSLVHARWRDAVARGTPALVVQAVEMSRPILERLGFERLGEIRMLVDLL